MSRPKKPTKKTPREMPRVPPMRGGALSQLTAAFRLRQAVIGGSAEVPEGTAKHGLSDQRDIGREKHVALLRTAVDELFSAEYLTARGLDPRAATEHNDLVTQALDVVLTAWDRMAVMTNVAPDHPEQIKDILGLATGFGVELSLRLAAYEALYGYLHPFLAEVPSWMVGPKLKPWWKSVEARARRPIKVSQLYGNGELESHTIREFRGGKTLPKEGTLSVLARRLAAHGIQDRSAERDAGPAELAFELRVAVAVADQRHVVERLLSPRAEDGLMMQLGVLRHVLKSAPDSVTTDLLRHGTQGRWWPVVEERFKATVTAQMFEWAFRMKADADRRLAEAKKNPTKVGRDQAEADLQQAAYLRSLDPRPGADGPEKRLAEFFENASDISLVVATDGQHQLRKHRAELSAELKADGLCMEAVAPWLNLPPEEQEKRYREAVRVCDWSAYAHRALGQHLRRFGKVDETILHLRRSVDLNPENEEGREWLLLVHAERGDYDDMLALTADSASSPMLRALRAVALLKTGDMAAAEKLACAVLEEHPRQSVALRVLAECLRVHGDERKARELETKADFYERGVRSPGG